MKDLQDYFSLCDTARSTRSNDYVVCICIYLTVLYLATIKNNRLSDLNILNIINTFQYTFKRLHIGNHNDNLEDKRK